MVGKVGCQVVHHHEIVRADKHYVTGHVLQICDVFVAACGIGSQILEVWRMGRCFEKAIAAGEILRVFPIVVVWWCVLSLTVNEKRVMERGGASAIALAFRG